MRNPVDLAHLFTGIENDRFVEHWHEHKLHEVVQQLGAIAMHKGVTR